MSGGAPQRAPGSPAVVAGEAERFVPACDGPDLAYEHLHRYVLAARVVGRGMRVLDLACGSGYGTQILRDAGAEVFALDRDLRPGAAPLRRVCARAEQLPFAAGCFDAVVCFEAIEHVPDPPAVLDEIVRVLRGPRILLVSTPDRDLYSGRAHHENPFHCAELSRSEFEALLGARFPHVTLHGQSLWAGSWIARLGDDPPGALGPRTVTPLADPRAGAPERAVGAPWAEPSERILPTPVYLIAACAGAREGADRLAETLPSETVLHDTGQWLLGRWFAGLREAAALLAQIEHAREGIDDLEAQVAAARDENDSLNEQAEAARAAFTDLESQLERARAHDAELVTQLSRAREGQEDLERQLGAARTAADDLAGQLARARDGQTRLEQELGNSRAQTEQLESELARAREGQHDLEEQLTAARAHAAGLARQIEDARLSHGDLEAQVEAARVRNGALTSELARAAAAQRDLERQIEAAREAGADQAAQIEAARALVADLSSQLERAAIDNRALVAERDRLAARLEPRLVRWAVALARADRPAE